LQAAAPLNKWRWWLAPLALVGGLLVAEIAGLFVEVPAALLGANITASHLPGGLELADTVVLDASFIFAAVFCAGLSSRPVRAWQFGLRPPRMRWRNVALLIVGLIVCVLIFSAIWALALHVNTKEKVLEQLGANEGTALLLLSALLTCVIAPICEEFLFRGFVFSALRNLAGVWPAAVLTGLVFGGVHASSAPVADLVPLAALGFGLCLLYWYTDSLYPCIAAHALNNSLAFGAQEEWGWGILALMVCALGTIALLAFALKRLGVITPPPSVPSTA
jgi:membrane protease YdiL (CAAX protease family)